MAETAAKALVDVRTADAARKLGDANLESVWRARPDGTIEVARPSWGRVELHTVSRDGTPQLVEASPRSVRKVASEICFMGGALFLAVSVVGGFVSSRLFSIMGLSFVLFPLGFLLRWRSQVRPWVRQRFGTDEDWVIVPWDVEGAPATGNQVIAISALSHAYGRTASYRNLAHGAVEVAVRRRGKLDLHRLDRFGTASLVETYPGRRQTLAKVRGEGLEWHEVFTSAPTD